MNDEAKDEFKGKVVAEFAPPCESVANKASVKALPGKAGRMAASMESEMAALDKAFRHFDKDNSGFLDKAEFRHVLTDIGSAPMTDKEFKAVWKNVDENNDGKIDYAEFIQWLCL